MYKYTTNNSKVMESILVWINKIAEQVLYIQRPRTTVSQDVQTWFSVQLAFAKFLSKIKGNFKYSASIMDTALPQKIPFILDRNLAHRKSGVHVLWYSSPCQ